jgi:hypothetical protein
VACGIRRSELEEEEHEEESEFHSLNVRLTGRRGRRGPADRNDKLVAVDDKKVADLLPKEVGALLQGEAGTGVVITYEPFDVENKGEIKVRERERAESMNPAYLPPPPPLRCIESVQSVALVHCGLRRAESRSQREPARQNGRLSVGIRHNVYSSAWPQTLWL